MPSKTIIITGTHHTPAIELIRQLKNDKKTNWKIFYITHSYKTETHIKNSLKPLLGKNIYKINCGKFDRNSLIKSILGISKTLTAIFGSLKIIGKLKPDIVISFGGYISVPVIISAWLSHIPSISHEQTTTASLSTKINSLFVNKIALSFPTKFTNIPKHKQIVTGNLIRQEIFSTTTKNYKKLNQKLSGKPLIFISGGNQGSSSINQTFLKIAHRLSQKYTIIHHTGILDYQLVRKLTKNYPDYYLSKYVSKDDIGWVLNSSNLIINRSGANYCQEIVALGKKSILIPLPFSQQNEQLKNALWVKRKLPRLTTIIDQKDLTPNKLYQAINHLSPLKTTKNQVKPIQNNQILDLIHTYV